MLNAELEKIKNITTVLLRIERLLTYMKIMAVRAAADDCLDEERSFLNDKITTIKCELNFLAECIIEMETDTTDDNKFYQ